MGTNSDEESILKTNREIIEKHFQIEADEQAERIVETYADEILWELPALQVSLKDKSLIVEQYKKIFAGTGKVHEITPLDRYVTKDRAFDDRILIFEALEPNIWGVEHGKTMHLRLAHSFHLKDGLIYREIAYEIWRVID